MGLQRLAQHVDVVAWQGEGKPEPSDLQPLARGVTGILALGNDRIDAALLDAAGPPLRVVALASMGFDAVDVAAARAREIVVTHTPGILAETTADLAFALILMARRQLGAARDSLYEGRWRVFRMGDYLGLDVHHATLGLIGCGQIGQAVARRAVGFGMRVIHFDPAVPGDSTWSTAVSFAQLLAESDIVSVHVPLTPDTHHLIGPAELQAMKDTATLVNTSRGGIVDETALLEALGAGTIHSAGLDVFEREPLGSDIAALTAEQRLIALPHIGSATEGTRATMVDLAVDNVLDVLAGKPAKTPLPGLEPIPRTK